MHWRGVAALAAAWCAGLLAVLRLERSTAAAQLYLTVSLFVLIACNLGTRRDGMSAYSVFNAGCAPLLGQLNPDQFENEIRHRPLVENGGGDGSNHYVPGTSQVDGMDEHDRILQEMREEIQRKRRRARSAAGAPAVGRRR